jgi:hypothetical protein
MLLMMALYPQLTHRSFLINQPSPILRGGAAHNESEGNMNIPKNCAVCPYTSICHAPHYGGSRCTFEKEIIEKILVKSTT